MKTNLMKLSSITIGTLRIKYNYLERIEYSLPPRTREKLKDSIARAKASLNMVESIAWKRDKFIAPPSHSYFEEKPSKADFEKTVLGHKYMVIKRLMTRELFAANLSAILPFKNREEHCHILSGTGGGKSQTMKAMVYDDSRKKYGTLVIDPHGSLVDDILSLNIPDEDIVYLSAKFAKEGLNFKLNIFDHPYHSEPAIVKEPYIALRAKELMGSFAKIFESDFTEHMKRLTFNAMLLLLNMPGAKLQDLINLLRPATDSKYRQLAKDHYNENVRYYFEHDFNARQTLITRVSVLTRFENVLSNYYFNQIMNAEKSTFDLKGLLDDSKCVLMNLSQGLLGEDGSRILGVFVLAELTTMALQREDIPEAERTPVFVYLDEMQVFLTDRLSKMLSEGRKYGVSLILAHQYLSQFSEKNREVRDAVLSNCNIRIFGALSYKDYNQMCKETGFQSRSMPKLKHGRFVLKLRDCTPIIIQAHGHLVKKKPPYYISASQLRKRIAMQKRLYYVKNSVPGHSYPKQDQTFTPVIEKLI